MANVEIVIKAKDQASGTINKIGSALGSLGKAAAGVAIGGLAATAAGFGAAAVSGLQFNNSMEQVEAKLFAFLKDGAAVADTLEMIRERAARTPFAFEEMAEAAAALTPTAKASGEELENLIEIAEVLAASNPAEGLAGAAFSLREAASGDLTSVIERFNLSRTTLNQLKEEGVPALEAVQIAMEELGLDASLVSNLAETATGRWSTFKDTLQGLFATATGPLFDQISAGLGTINEKLADPVMQERLENIAITVGEVLANAFQLAKDGVITFVQAFRGEWTDDAIIHPLHRFIGQLGIAAAWLQENLPVAIAFVSDAWNNTLLPALNASWVFIRDSLIPALSDVWGWLEEKVPAALQKTSDFWNNTLLPALETVWGFVQDNVIPIFDSLSNQYMEDVNQRTIQWHTLWTEKLQPALNAIWELIRDKVVPWISELVGGWEGLVGIIGGAISKLQEFKSFWDSLPSRAIELGFGIGSGIADLLDGTRALGGPVTANGAYLVGERGPELFVPQSSGRIIPNNQTPTGNIIINATLNNGLDIEQLAYQITRIQQRRTA